MKQALGCCTAPEPENFILGIAGGRTNTVYRSAYAPCLAVLIFTSGYRGFAGLNGAEIAISMHQVRVSRI
jgi:hypothetical protein